MFAVFGFVLFVGFVGLVLYLLMIFREVPGAAEERFGKLEALPEDVGKWKTDVDSPEGRAATAEGLKREVRYLFDPEASFGRGKLTLQVRYRDLSTNEITRIDPEEVVKRKRIRE